MSNTGMFDADEWRFERQRDEKAAKELEIRERWKGWVDDRRIGNKVQDAEYEKFAAIECERQIKELK